MEANLTKLIKYTHQVEILSNTILNQNKYLTGRHMSLVMMITYLNYFTLVKITIQTNPLY